MKGASLLAAALLLNACVTSEPVTTQDGSLGHAIDCARLAGDAADAEARLTACYQRAGEICGARGFVVVSGSADTTGVANRSMIVQCKGDENIVRLAPPSQPTPK